MNWPSKVMHLAKTISAVRIDSGDQSGSDIPVRLELEDRWRTLVHAAWLRYQQATEDLRRVRLKYASDLPSPDGHYAVVEAQRVEIWALKAYRRAMKILHELQAYGKVPPPGA
jgi:hypothetical protein